MLALKGTRAHVHVCVGRRVSSRTSKMRRCCDDASAPCVAGLPTTCSDACADVLLPMQRACNDFLAMIGMQQTINTAAAMCGGGH